MKALIRRPIKQLLVAFSTCRPKQGLTYHSQWGAWPDSVAILPSSIGWHLRYLNGTANFGLLYRKGDSDKCDGYSDADWAGSLDDRKSTSGYLFQCSGAAVSWKSCKQSCVALSTAEAEYVALAAAAQEAVWLQNLIGELLNGPPKEIGILEDNQSAICLAKNSQC